MTPCNHIDFGPDNRVVRCSRTGVLRRVAVTADGATFAMIGRRPLTACYCADHGGVARAAARLAAAWSYLAPACVGDDAAVTDAGVAGLGSEHAYVVLRFIGAVNSTPSLWQVAITLTARTSLRATHGSLLRTLGLWGGVRTCRDAAHAEEISSCLYTHTAVRPTATYRAAHDRVRNPWHVGLGLGSHLRQLGAFATQAAALDAAVPVWLDGVMTRVAEITQQRGGTLAWGYAVVPLSAPILVEPRAGESAWDAAA
jgi:hypothetical protein